MGQAPPGLLSSSCTLRGVFPSHLMDLRDEVNYAVPESPAKPKLSPSCPQSLWNAILVPRTHVQEWHTCLGLSKIVFISHINWQINQNLWAFQILIFFNRKLKLFTNWIGHADLGHMAFYLYNKDTLCLLGPEATVGICPCQRAQNILPGWAGRMGQRLRTR